MVGWKAKLSHLILFLLIVLFALYPYYAERQKDNDQSWHKIQRERKIRIAEVSAKYNLKNSMQINFGRFYYSPAYNLMMCSTAKAGSTTFFLTTFTQILVGEDYWIGDEGPGGENHHSKS